MTAGRPRKKPTKVMRVPLDKVRMVMKLLGKPMNTAQKPFVHIRVPHDQVAKIQRVIQGK